MSNLNYLPTGSGGTGSHPTMAGNVLDPNIQSDGKMTSGPGVGGTSEQHVREEGAEHIRRNPETTSSSVQAGSGLGSSGGLSSFGQGGVSGSSYEGDRTIGSETGQTTSGSSGGVLASTMSYLGLGGQSGDNTSSYGETSGSGYGSREANTALGGAGVAGASSTLGSERETSSYGETGDRSYGGQSTGGLGSDNQSYGGESTGGLGSGPVGGSSGNELASREEVATRAPTDSNVHTGSDPLDSAAPVDTETADPVKGDKAYEAKLHDKHASTRENTDAIPTAGGEKLGARHWGESKIVPENPKPAGGDSDEFSKTVRDNTNRNTGPVSEPTGTGAVQKESTMEKLKDKLHLGSSLGAADAH